MQRIDRVHDDLVIPADNKGGLLDVLEVSKSFPHRLAPLHYSRDLGLRDLLTVLLVAILGARCDTLEEFMAGGLAGGGLD